MQIVSGKKESWLPSALQFNRAQLMKIAAVTAASAGLFGLQLGANSSTVAKVACGAALTTALAEKFRPSSDWFGKGNIHSRAFIKNVATPFLLNGLSFLAFFSLIGEHGIVQAVQRDTYQNRNLRNVALAVLVAPFCEEILFRGFLQERIEDGGRLVGLSKERQMQASVATQAVVFGLLHLPFGQVRHPSDMIPVGLVIGGMGYYLGQKKNSDQSLLTPMAMHMASNAGNQGALLLCSFLNK